jgi:hypothetical protein
MFNSANPADLPVEQLTKLELVLNLKRRKLGLVICREFLLSADEVIKGDGRT